MPIFKKSEKLASHVLRDPGKSFADRFGAFCGGSPFALEKARLPCLWRGALFWYRSYLSAKLGTMLTPI